MSFNIQDLSHEQIQRGLACKSLDEFVSFVKAEGFDFDEKEAQAIFEEMYAMELSDEELEAVAGGKWCINVSTPSSTCGDYCRRHISKK